MYIKTIRKYCQTEKTTHTYFRLSESYRDEYGVVRQRMVLGLGRLPELPDFDQKVLFLERLNELIKGKPTLFSSKDENVEQLAHYYYGQLKQKKKIDRASDATDDFDTVNLNTLKNKDIREIGAESLCYQALRQLGIDHYLVKPFDISELVGIIQESFPLLDNSASSVDIGKEKNEIQILVVEDNKMNQKVIGTMLKTLGYSFDLADDGISGYNCAKSKKYDLILMDLIMPEMDGFQAAQKIIDLYRNILIVAISADNMPETKRKAELSGIKDFISKPVRMEELKKLFAKHF